jgi:hypothetical protein
VIGVEHQRRCCDIQQYAVRPAYQCAWQQPSAGQKAQCVLGYETGAHRFQTTDALTASLLPEADVSMEVRSLQAPCVTERVLQLCLL